MDNWTNLDLVELRTIDNAVSSVAFYLPLLFVQLFLVLFYPLTILIGINTFSDYLAFWDSVIKNTWEVPSLIFYNIYAIGWNGVILFFLVIQTLL